MKAIDTNVLVYALDRDSKFHRKSLTFLEQNFNDIVIPYKVLIELVVVLSKLNFDHNDILKEFKNLYSNFLIIFPNQYTIFVFEELYRKYNPKGIKTHDLDIVATSISNNIFDLVTFNYQDFKKYREVNLITP